MLFHQQLRRTSILMGIIGISGLALVILAIHYRSLDLGFSWTTMPMGFARVSFSFFVGMAIRRASLRAVRRKRLIALGLIPATLVIFALATDLTSQIASIFIALPIIVWLAVRFEPSVFREYFNAARAASYAIYTLHKPVYQLLLGAMVAVLPFRPELLAPWIGVVYIGLICAASVLIDRIYDNPARKWLSQITSPLQQKMT